MKSKKTDTILKATCGEHHVLIVTASGRGTNLPIDYRDYAFTPEISHRPRRSSAKAGANARTHETQPLTNGVLPKTFQLK